MELRKTCYFFVLCAADTVSLCSSAALELAEIACFGLLRAGMMLGGLCHHRARVTAVPCVTAAPMENELLLNRCATIFLFQSFGLNF